MFFVFLVMKNRLFYCCFLVMKNEKWVVLFFLKLFYFVFSNENGLFYGCF